MRQHPCGGGGEPTSWQQTRCAFQNRFSRLCGAFNSPCVLKCRRPTDTPLKAPKRVLASQWGQPFGEVGGGGRGGGGRGLRSKGVVTNCIVSSGLFRHHLFHLHVIKIEMYNLSPQTQAAVSWKELCSPARAGDGQEAGSRKASLGTVRKEPLLDHPLPAHTHTCAQCTHAQYVRAYICTRNTDVHAHTCA